MGVCDETEQFYLPKGYAADANGGDKAENSEGEISLL